MCIIVVWHLFWNPLINANQYNNMLIIILNNEYILHTVYVAHHSLRIIQFLQSSLKTSTSSLKLLESPSALKPPVDFSGRHLHNGVSASSIHTRKTRVHIAMFHCEFPGASQQLAEFLECSDHSPRLYHHKTLAYTLDCPNPPQAQVVENVRIQGTGAELQSPCTSPKSSANRCAAQKVQGLSLNSFGSWKAWRMSSLPSFIILYHNIIHYHSILSSLLSLNRSQRLRKLG